MARTPSKAAPLEAMQELHADLAETFKQVIKLRDEDGKPLAAVLNAARQFLKDNEITAAPGTLDDLSKELQDLPFPGDAAVDDPASQHPAFQAHDPSGTRH